MTLPELKELAQESPDKLIYLGTVADLYGSSYKVFKERFVYRRKIIKPIKKDPMNPKGKLYIEASEAYDFLQAIYRIREYKKKYNL